MWFVILWLSLGVLLVVSFIVRGRWVTGQTAFTGIWFGSLTGLWLFPESHQYVSATAAALIVGVHFSFFIGCFLYTLMAKERRRLEKDVVNMPRLWRISFWVLAPLGVLGGWLAVSATGALQALQDNQLDFIRSQLIEAEIQMPVAVRFLANLLYPATVIGAICFLSTVRFRSSWFFVLLPVVGLFLYGFASGGRGAVLIGGAMLVWVLLVGQSEALANVNTRWLLFAFFVLMVLFSGFIVTTRSGDDTPLQSLSVYFVGPVPAFSEWLTLHPVSPLEFSASNISVIRELMRAFGSSVVERQVGADVVNIPFQFNVFTALADQLPSFGLAGTVILYGCVGFASARLEYSRQSHSVMAVRGLLYSYLSFSLVTDMAFFIVGLWLSLFLVGFLIPFLAAKDSRKGRRTISAVS